MDLYDVMRTTGAVRRFTDDPLPADVLERILDRATREALGALSATGARRYIAQKRNGESPWNPLQPMQVTAQELAATEVPADLSTPLLTSAVVLVVCVDLAVVAAFDQDLDRIGVIAGASVYPFVWNVLLAARNEGFGGVLTTMAVAEEPRVKALLNIPDDHAVAAVLPLGKPRHQVSKLTRRSVSEFATREKFDGESL